MYGQGNMIYNSVFKKSTDKLLNVNQGLGLNIINAPVGVVPRNHNSFPHKDGPISGVTIGSQLSTKYQKRNAVDFHNGSFVPPTQMQTQVTTQSLLANDPFSSFSKVFINPNG